ncbi:hypothetical protein GCM10009660_29430 [Catellatospora bangladeshensis]
MEPALVPAVLALLLIAGTGIFLLACRWSADEPWPAADARRLARLRRAAPWVVGASAAVVVLNLVLVAIPG